MREMKINVNVAAASSAAGDLWVRVQTDTEPSEADHVNYSKVDSMYVCLSNHLGNHRCCSARKRFSTAACDQRR